MKYITVQCHLCDKNAKFLYEINLKFMFFHIQCGIMEKKNFVGLLNPHILVYMYKTSELGRGKI